MKKLKFQEFAQRKKLDVEKLSHEQILNICLSVGCEIPSELLKQKKLDEFNKENNVEPQVATENTGQLENQSLEVVLLEKQEVLLEVNDTSVVMTTEEIDDLKQHDEEIKSEDLELEDTVEQKSSILRKRKRATNTNF